LPQGLHNLLITVFLLSSYGCLLQTHQLAALWVASQPWAPPVFALAAAIKQQRAARGASAVTEGAAAAGSAGAPGMRACLVATPSGHQDLSRGVAGATLPQP
jgi:hypothetical protein